MTPAERVARVRFPRGFHGRRMAEFIRRARTFEAQVRVTYLGDREDEGRVLEGLDGKQPKGRTVDGKSIFGLSNLERFARRGDRLRIEAEGEDAKEAVEALALYLESAGEAELYTGAVT